MSGEQRTGQTPQRTGHHIVSRIVDDCAMATVFIPTQLKQLTDGNREIEVQGSTVAELLEGLEQRYPGVKARLCQQGELVPGWQVSIDHVMTSQGLAAPVPPGSEVHFLPAIGGG